MALTSATVTSTPSVIVADTVENFTAAANEPVIVAYAPSASDTEAPEGAWFERRPGDAVTRALLGDGHIWAKLVRVDRTLDPLGSYSEIELPIAAW